MKKTTGKEKNRTSGRFHFSRDAERTLFFFLTLAMLAAGLLIKMEIF